MVSLRVVVSSILQISFDRMKDCNTIQGGERINSKVIRSDCYLFRALSHPDSSTISGKDLSYPNKITSQVSWLKWTSSKGRAGDWVPGGSQRPAFHTTSSTDTAMQGGCLSSEAGKSDPAVLLKPQQHGKTTKSEQFGRILGGKKVHLTCNWNSMSIFGKDSLMKGTSWTP